jgi:uncharacterized protein YndB with AHSA1/START domain
MSTAGGRVTPLRRPPVRQSVVVRGDRRHTFGTFVSMIGMWWPVTPFSAGRDRVRDVTFEQRQGGRVYETWQDGTEIEWGEVLAWEPPERFVMTWNMTSVATEVELRFAELGPVLTRVTVEHRGWDRLTEEQLAKDCALPGGYLGGVLTQALSWHWIFFVNVPTGAVAVTAGALLLAGERENGPRVLRDRRGLRGLRDGLGSRGSFRPGEHDPAGRGRTGRGGAIHPRRLAHRVPAGRRPSGRRRADRGISRGFCDRCGAGRGRPRTHRRGAAPAGSHRA